VSFVGLPDLVTRQLRQFISQTLANEVIVVSHIYDHVARLRSYELAVQMMGS